MFVRILWNNQRNSSNHSTNLWKKHTLFLFPGSAKVVIPGGSISLLLTTAFVEIVERFYSAETMYESDPKMNVFIV